MPIGEMQDSRHRNPYASLFIGDGAMGFWVALEEVWPQTPNRRCWIHKTANILNKMLKSIQSKAK
jgi:transposase-like protein